MILIRIYTIKKKRNSFLQKNSAEAHSSVNGWHSDLKELQHIGVYLD